MESLKVRRTSASDEADAEAELKMKKKKKKEKEREKSNVDWLVVAIGERAEK